MKHIEVTEVIRSEVDLSDVAIDQVVGLLDDYDAIRAKYHNIRFSIRHEGDMESSWNVYDIVGNRWETDDEARKRIDAKKRVAEKKKMIKMTKIEKLELELAKLKGHK